MRMLLVVLLMWQSPLRSTVWLWLVWYWRRLSLRYSWRGHGEGRVGGQVDVLEVVGVEEVLRACVLGMVLVR